MIYRILTQHKWKKEWSVLKKPRGARLLPKQGRRRCMMRNVQSKISSRRGNLSSGRIQSIGNKKQAINKLDARFLRPYREMQRGIYMYMYMYLYELVTEDGGYMYIGAHHNRPSPSPSLQIESLQDRNCKVLFDSNCAPLYSLALEWSYRSTLTTLSWTLCCQLTWTMNSMLNRYT